MPVYDQENPPPDSPPDKTNAILATLYRCQFRAAQYVAYEDGTIAPLMRNSLGQDMSGPYIHTFN